jgi:beta-lactamase superfamily II metal-dependent hydrolase
MTFTLTALPASDGDCFLLSYGSSPVRHVLIDGGRTSTYSFLRPELRRIVQANERIELLALSHIDADHIEGLLPLVEDEELGLEIKEVWFNGYDQLFDFERLGFAQADALSNVLRAKRLKVNDRFGGKAVMVPDSGPLPRIELDGGMSLTILSPDRFRLDKLRTEWAMWRGTVQAPVRQGSVGTPGLEILGRKPMPSVIDVELLASGAERIDTETPNGSSIAFVAERDGRKALLAADANPTLLTESVSRLVDGSGERYRVDLLKVSHHGSIGNTTRALVEGLDCDRFLFSTDGSRHRHPDPEAVAKILKYSPSRPKELLFNYATARTLPWDDTKLRAAWYYTCRFTADGHIEIDV